MVCISCQQLALAGSTGATFARTACCEASITQCFEDRTILRNSNRLAAFLQLDFESNVILTNHINRLEILEVDTAFGPVTRESFDFFHQRFGSAAEDMGRARRHQIVPEIIDSVRIAVIVVHAVYVGAIRPSADAQIKREMALQAAGEDFIPERSFVVVIRDFEQEACFILLIWALAIMGYKGRQMIEEQKILEQRLLDVPEGTSILPQDAREYSRPLEALGLPGTRRVR